MPKPARPADCAIGDAALARGAWEEARVAFQGVLAAPVEFKYVNPSDDPRNVKTTATK
jgi:hypothetical protein